MYRFCDTQVLCYIDITSILVLWYTGIMVNCAFLMAKYFLNHKLECFFFFILIRFYLSTYYNQTLSILNIVLF